MDPNNSKEIVVYKDSLGFMVLSIRQQRLIIPQNMQAEPSTFDPSLLFVCVEVLRPSQPNGVMSSAVSLPNHTFTGQA